MILQLILGLALPCLAAPSAGDWALVHSPESDYGYNRFAVRDGRLLALPGLSASKNGGLTWEDSETVGDDMSDADSPSGGIWLGAEAMTADLFRLENPADEWQPLHASTLPIRVVRFFDASRGVAAGEGILRTEDGGRTWKWAAEFDRAYVDDPKALFVLDRTRGWLAATGRDSIRIWKSDDAGRTWEAVAYIFDRKVHGLLFTDKKRGWILTSSQIGSETRLSTTSDGGKSWRTVKRFSSGTKGLSALAARDEDEAWVAGPGGLLHTRDGGETWETWEMPALSDVDEIGLHYGKARDGRYLLLGTLKHESDEDDEGKPIRFTMGTIFRLLLK